jgi:hypothetical protein
MKSSLYMSGPESDGLSIEGRLKIWQVAGCPSMPR